MKKALGGLTTLGVIVFVVLIGLDFYQNAREFKEAAIGAKEDIEQKEAEEKSTNAKNTYDATEKACEESEAILNDLSSQYDDIISWADMYDHGSIEAKKMVVNCLIRRIEVYRGYKLHVDFNIAVEQFGITAQEKIPASI